VRVRCAISLLAALLVATVAAAQDDDNVLAVPTAGQVFAITLDAHAAENGAEPLLAFLRERRIKVTLFVTGRFALENPKLLRIAAEDGHEIGVHTFDHPHLTTWAYDRRNLVRPGVTRVFLQDQLRRSAVAIQAVTGRAPAPLWRAPYGEHNATIRAWAAELGYLQVDWTRAPGDALDALDWVDDPSRRNYLDAEAIARRILGFEARHGISLAGSIILMHLGSTRPQHPLLEALPVILDETDHRGLRPVTVTELLRLGGRPWPPEKRAPATGQPTALGHSDRSR
jgi:peptidoglycan-N-acetylglucosamine deacetylase